MDVQHTGWPTCLLVGSMHTCTHMLHVQHMLAPLARLVRSSCAPCALLLRALCAPLVCLARSSCEPSRAVCAPLVRLVRSSCAPCALRLARSSCCLVCSSTASAGSKWPSLVPGFLAAFVPCACSCALTPFLRGWVSTLHCLLAPCAPCVSCALPLRQLEPLSQNGLSPSSQICKYIYIYIYVYIYMDIIHMAQPGCEAPR
jgi:hypothetical protein